MPAAAKLSLAPTMMLSMLSSTVPEMLLSSAKPPKASISPSGLMRSAARVGRKCSSPMAAR